MLHQIAELNENTHKECEYCFWKFFIVNCSLAWIQMIVSLTLQFGSWEKFLKKRYSFISTCVCVSVTESLCLCNWACVCGDVCVCERKRERKGERMCECSFVWETVWLWMCVCLCMGVGEGVSVSTERFMDLGKPNFPMVVWFKARANFQYCPSCL